MEPRLKSGCIANLNLNVEIEKSHAELGLDNICSSICYGELSKIGLIKPVTTRVFTKSWNEIEIIHYNQTCLLKNEKKKTTTSS